MPTQKQGPAPSGALAARHDRELEWHETHAGISDDDQISKYKRVVLARMRELQWRMLGPVAGKVVLDVGCGTGREAVALARQGAQVVALDLSPALIARARDRATAAGVAARIEFIVGAAEELASNGRRFDVVLGNGILHHIDFRTFQTSLARLMKPDGVAQFQEPLIHHPLLRLYRLLTPRLHSPTERPLARSDVMQFVAGFRDVRIEFVNLVGLFLLPVPYVLGSRVTDTLLRWSLAADHALYGVLPGLQGFSQYVIIQVAKPEDRSR